DHRLDLGHVAHVGRDGDGRPAEVANLAGDALGGVREQIIYGDGRATSCQTNRDGPPVPLAGPADQGNLADEVPSYVEAWILGHRASRFAARPIRCAGPSPSSGRPDRPAPRPTA